MTKLMIAFVATASLMSFGCKKKGGGEMEKMESFQKQMCDCHDKGCADKVQAEMSKWSTDSMKTTDEKPDPEMAKKSGEVMQKYSDCMSKAMGGDMKGGDMKGGDMKGGDMKGEGGDMKGADTKGTEMKMQEGEMKGGDMKGGDMKGSDMKGDRK